MRSLEFLREIDSQGKSRHGRLGSVFLVLDDNGIPNSLHSHPVNGDIAGISFRLGIPKILNRTHRKEIQRESARMIRTDSRLKDK